MKRFVTTMLLALAPVAMSWAQGAPQPGNQPGRQAPGQQAPGQQAPGQPGQVRGQGGMELSRHLATGLLLENQEEVALAKFAKEHTKSDEAKQFADMLIKDHEQAASKLQQLVPQQMTVFFRGAGDSDDSRSEDQGQRRSARQSAEAGQSGQAGQFGQQRGQDASDPMTAFQQKVAEECYKLTCKELSEHEGSEFDRCFVVSQIGGHIAMLAQLKASEDFASPELQPIIQDCQQAVEQHLDKAKELAKAWQKDERK